MVLIHNGTLQKGTITKRSVSKQYRYTALHYKIVRYKTEQCYKTLHGSKWHITQMVQLHKVHVTKLYTVTGWNVGEQYIIITVQYQKGFVVF